MFLLIYCAYIYFQLRSHAYLFDPDRAEDCECNCPCGKAGPTCACAAAANGTGSNNGNVALQTSTAARQIEHRPSRRSTLARRATMDVWHTNPEPRPRFTSPERPIVTVLTEEGEEEEEEEEEVARMSVVAASTALLLVTLTTSFCADYCAWLSFPLFVSPGGRQKAN